MELMMETCLSGFISGWVGLGYSTYLWYIYRVSLAITSPILAFFWSTMLTVYQNSLIVKFITYRLRFMQIHPNGFRSASVPPSLRDIKHSMHSTPISLRYFDNFSMLLRIFRLRTASLLLTLLKDRVSVQLPQNLTRKTAVALGLLRQLMLRWKVSRPAMVYFWQPGGMEGRLWRSSWYQWCSGSPLRESGSFMLSYYLNSDYYIICCILIQASRLKWRGRQEHHHLMLRLKTQTPPSYSKDDVVLAKIQNSFPWPAIIVVCKGFALNKDIGVAEDYYQVRFFDKSHSWAILYNYQITPLTLKRIAQLKHTFKSNSHFINSLKQAQKQIKRQKLSLGGALLQRHQRYYEGEQPTLPLEEYSKSTEHLLQKIRQQRKNSGWSVSTESQKELRRRKRYGLCSRHTYIQCTIVIATNDGQITTSSNMNGLVSHYTDSLNNCQDDQDDLDDTRSEQHQMQVQHQQHQNMDYLEPNIAHHSQTHTFQMPNEAPVEIEAPKQPMTKESKNKKTSKGKQFISFKPQQVARAKLKAIIECIRICLQAQPSPEAQEWIGKFDYLLAQEQVKVAVQVIASNQNPNKNKLTMFFQDVNQFFRQFHKRNLDTIKSSALLKEKFRSLYPVLPLATFLHSNLGKTIARISLSREKQSKVEQSIGELFTKSMKISCQKFGETLKQLQGALSQ